MFSSWFVTNCHILKGNHQESASANNAANSVADVLETNISGVTKTDRNCMSAKAAGKEFQGHLSNSVSLFKDLLLS